VIFFVSIFSFSQTYTHIHTHTYIYKFLVPSSYSCSSSLSYLKVEVLVSPSRERERERHFTYLLTTVGVMNLNFFPNSLLPSAIYFSFYVTSLCLLFNIHSLYLLFFMCVCLFTMCFFLKKKDLKNF
jgi:hypothetical protein